MSCPAGFNSVRFWLSSGPKLGFIIAFQVVFERQNDRLNETVVYSDVAIRPGFLIMF